MLVERKISLTRSLSIFASRLTIIASRPLSYGYNASYSRIWYLATYGENIAPPTKVSTH